MLPLGKASCAMQGMGSERNMLWMKHLVLPCSTFTHGSIWLGSIGLTNESGHSVRLMSTALVWAKQGTSTLVPVGNGYVYVDDVLGNRSCASIFVGQESDTSWFGKNPEFPDTTGSCENIHARVASAPSKTSSETIDRCGRRLTSLETSCISFKTRHTHTHTQLGIQWIRRQGQGQGQGQDKDKDKDKAETRNTRTKVLGVIKSVYYVPSSTT